MKKNLEAIVESIVMEVTDSHGFELVDVEYVKESGEFYLRIYIDKPEGISLAECETISRELSPILDEKDPIQENYFLEVSSPGLDRPLKKEKDFIRYKGREVELKLYKPLNGSKQFEGTLLELTPENIIKLEIDGSTVEFDKKDVAIIRLAIKF
ncbi:ribosome maturation factor RimP [Metaclostridioides mangenotii]|uniref:ribosome maturation factor RimP n=1 Tax=Metaclostridioides mangenotii TaxID=1540 RepID=UPI0004668837|nr:ribosome maturation factor RimP [Clostridioides mangenotii]